MESGENFPNVIPYDLDSILILTLYREELDYLDPEVGPMPPTKALKPELIEIFERWVMGGAPNTAAEAEALSPTPAYPAPAEETPTEAEP